MTGPLKAALIALPLALAGAMPMTAFAQTDTRPAFDSAAWIAEAGNGEAINPRGEMVAAAVAALPPGSTRDEVVALLGQPDETGDWWVYYAGATGLPVTGEVRLLVVEFDDGGRVSRVIESST